MDTRHIIIFVIRTIISDDIPLSELLVAESLFGKVFKHMKILFAYPTFLPALFRQKVFNQVFC